MLFMSKVLRQAHLFDTFRAPRVFQLFFCDQYPLVYHGFDEGKDLGQRRGG